MRKARREITDKLDLYDLVKNTDTLRLGLFDKDYPYVVPLSFGFEVVDDKYVFYIHGAKEGKKIQLLKENNHICVEGDILHRYKDTNKSVTALFESFIGFGKAYEVILEEEKLKALKLILEHCGYDHKEINEQAMPFVSIYRLEIETLTGKERTKLN